MIQIGNVPEINGIKAHFNELKKAGLIEEWELPYERLLTRLDAAVFFLSPSKNLDLEKLWSLIKEKNSFILRANDEKRMSLMEWRLEFN